MKRLRVLSVASEVYPLVKTGGLADVVAALPPALAVPPGAGAICDGDGARHRQGNAASDGGSSASSAATKR